MGKYLEEHGKTRVGSFLKNAAPHILDLVSDILPDNGALGIIKNIIKSDNSLSDKDKATALELLQLDLDNTKDAREMQKAALSQSDTFSKRFVYYLATFWSVVGASYLFMATFTTIVNPKMADTVLGFLLGTIISTLINFFYGSKAKTQ